MEIIIMELLVRQTLVVAVVEQIQNLLLLMQEALEL